MIKNPSIVVYTAKVGGLDNTREEAGRNVVKKMSSI